VPAGGLRSSTARSQRSTASGAQKSPRCPITLPNEPGLAKAAGPPLRRVAGLAHDLATAALLGKTERAVSLIRRLALDTSPEHPVALGSGAR